MSPFIHEALITGFKEGLKAGIVWLVCYSFFLLREKKPLIRPFYAGLFIVLLFSAAFFFLPAGPALREQLGNVISLSFALFLISSAAALYHASGVNVLNPFRTGSGKSGLKDSESRNAPLAGLLIFILTVVFFGPDSAASVLFLKELSFMKESPGMTVISALAGALIAFLMLFATVKFLKPFRIGKFFDLPQLLLFLAVVKLLGGGTRGVSEITLIPSIQRGFMKFAHDFIHQTFVLVMVPDHPLLKTTVWNFIGIFFGPNIALFAALFSLLFFPLMFIYHSLVRQVPEPEAETGARKRKIKYLLLSDRRRKALPVFLFIALIIVSWFAGSGESVSRLYAPEPKPVVEDKGTVLIPLNDPTMDLMDGALHKFALSHEGQEIRLLIIRKPDKTLSVCLDACEICPPEGYGQREDMVVCIYCSTPIPVSTLGKPGGCNPIPLKHTVEGGEIVISTADLDQGARYFSK